MDAGLVCTRGGDNPTPADLEAIGNFRQFLAEADAAGVLLGGHGFMMEPDTPMAKSWRRRWQGYMDGTATGPLDES